MDPLVPGAIESSPWVVVPDAMRQTVGTRYARGCLGAVKTRVQDRETIIIYSNGSNPRQDCGPHMTVSVHSGNVQRAISLFVWPLMSLCGYFVCPVVYCALTGHSLCAEPTRGLVSRHAAQRYLLWVHPCLCKADIPSLAGSARPWRVGGRMQ